MTISPIGSSTLSTNPSPSPQISQIWHTLRLEAAAASLKDAALTRAMNSAVLYHASFAQALAHRIAVKPANHDLDEEELLSVITQAFVYDRDIVAAAADDLIAIQERDPSNAELLTPFLHFKGFIALQAQRVARWLWHHDRLHLACHV